MTQVLHTEELSNVSASTGNLLADPFIVPDLDSRLVAALVFHTCGEKCLIDSWTKMTIQHVYADECNTVIKLDCWDLASCKPSDEPDCFWNDDPCIRARTFRECLAKWALIGKKTSFSYTDSSSSTSYISTDCLKGMIAEAEAECEQKCGVNSRCATYSCTSGYC